MSNITTSIAFLQIIEEMNCLTPNWSITTLWLTICNVYIDCCSNMSSFLGISHCTSNRSCHIKKSILRKLNLKDQFESGIKSLLSSIKAAYRSSNDWLVVAICCVSSDIADVPPSVILATSLIMETVPYRRTVILWRDSSSTAPRSRNAYVSHLLHNFLFS